VRVLPPSVDAVVDRASWAPPPIFELIARTGAVSRAQLELTFNLGVGMIAVVPPERVDDALALAAARGVPAWVAGALRPGSGAVGLISDYSGVAASWR